MKEAIAIPNPKSSSPRSARKGRRAERQQGLQRRASALRHPRVSLPGPVKVRLLGSRDQRITREGVLVIKAQQHRSLERNRDEALERLHELVARAAHVPKARRPPVPPRLAEERWKASRGVVRSSACGPGRVRLIGRTLIPGQATSCSSLCCSSSHRLELLELAAA